MNSKSLRDFSIIVVVGALVFGAIWLFQQPVADRDSGDTKEKAVPVALLTMGSFPLLDEILDQTVTTLKKSSDPKVEVRVFNPNFQQDLLRKSAREMVGGDFSILVSLSTPATQMLAAENRGKKPQIFAFVSTPSEIGIQGNVAPPNLTGFIDTVPLKQDFDLIQRIVGDKAKVGYIVNDGEAPARATYEHALKVVETTGMSIKKIPISTSSDVRAGLAPVLDQVDVLFFGPDSVAASATDLIVSIGADKNRPLFCTDMISVSRGCVGSVAPDYSGLGREIAGYVKRVANGESAASLPVVDYKEYVTYLNPTIAKKLGIHLPADLLQSATLLEAEKK